MVFLLNRIRFLHILLAVGFCLCLQDVNGQNDFDLWAQRVNWDGVTPWQYYLTIAPQTMGPNALPPPRLQEGKIHSSSHIEIRPEFYGGQGVTDETYDIYARAYYTLVPNKIAVEGYIVAYENYDMGAEVVNTRNARKASGQTTGDLHLSAIFALLQDHPSLPDIALDVNMKTSSGGQLRDMRYNDAAGYSFNLSFGKTLGRDSSQFSIRLHAMGGFYVWQIFDRTQQQNDAFSFGMGAHMYVRNWRFTNQLAGYLGYRNEGDKPFIFSTDIFHKLKMLDIGVGYSYGIQDYPYHGYRISTTYFFQR